ncbi:MAG: penicillin acylase family protein [Alphaproteobacteria bacterium]|nr:penicillin acylase family protein [Alphaproteobacteria bacterium]
MNKFYRFAKRGLIGVSLLALTAGMAVVGGGVYVFERAQPDYSGQASLPGLKAQVDIYRDANGVPHIFAANMNDAARALGYVHAGERLFQMETQRRAGQGRLSEIFGADMLGVDKFTRTLGLYALAQSSYAAMSPEAQAYFQAYADGVNAWLDTHKDALPPEFLLLRATPEPWKPADSIVWGKLMSLELSHNYHLEMLRGELAGKLPPDQLNWLFPMPPAGTPVTTQPVVPPTAQRDASNKLAALLGLGHAASNEWVIGGSRTLSGKPILANDPHLDLTAPILWYLARIVTPETNVKGATVPGLPIVLLGQNDHVAWGFTTTGSDVEDLFNETIDPADSTKYVTPQGSEPFTTRDEVIHVKGAPDVTLTVRATRHGPVMSDINERMAALAGAGHVMALAFTGLGDKDTTSEALMHMNRATNAAELIDDLKLYQTPPQNIVYADDAGAFGYINPGLVPVRKAGHGLVPADGASGDNDWDGTVPFDRLPHVENPAAGYVFNSNNAVVGPDSADYFGQDWEEPYRARRIQQMLSTNGQETLDMSAAMQGDHLSLAATDMLPLLMFVTPDNAREKQALDMLVHWDGVMDKDKPEPALFEAWLYQFHKHMLTEKVGRDLTEKGPFAAMTLGDLVANHAKDWCGDDACRAQIKQSLDDALDMMSARQGGDMSAWRWGHENIAQLTNKFFSHIPVLRRFSDLSVESSGDFYTLDRGGGFDNDAEHPFARTHGGGFRGLYDLSNPDNSRFMIATGQSGHLFSPHYGDLVERWVTVQSVALSGSADELKKSGADELVLEP